MNRLEIYQKISECGILPTTFVYNIEDTVQLAKVLYQTGIRVIELLQRTPQALEAIKKVKEALPEMTVGAGTVLHIDKAEQVRSYGVDYIVCPYYHQEIVDWCNEHGMAVIPGCATITEVSRGYDSGLRFFKYFPTNQLGGIEVIRQISEIYSDARYVATGGITMEQLFSYSASKHICAVGSVCMMPNELIEARAWDAIAELCKKSVAGSLGMSLVYSGGADAVFNREIQHFECGRCGYRSFPDELFQIGGRVDRGYLVNSVERALAYFRDLGMTETILMRDPDGTPEVADLLDDTNGTRLRFVARFKLA